MFRLLAKFYQILLSNKLINSAENQLFQSTINYQLTISCSPNSPLTFARILEEVEKYVVAQHDIMWSTLFLYRK